MARVQVWKAGEPVNEESTSLRDAMRFVDRENYVTIRLENAEHRINITFSADEIEHIKALTSFTMEGTAE
jgi:hypothetical protein